MAQKNKIAVIGCGAWGTALAAMLVRQGRDATLYARDAALAARINTTHENDAYLKGVTLPAAVTATADVAAAVADVDLALFVTPAQHVRAAFEKFKPYLPAGVPVVNAAKGIEIATGALLSDVAAEVLPDHAYAVLSGPNFAHEVAAGLPAAATFATQAQAEDARRWADMFRGDMFRPYISGDPVGVEIAGALKNVMAIACGIVEGKQLGQNARAAVMTRGMSEIRRFARTRGAQVETFLGMAGLGDLTLTCNSMASRNFSLGAAVGAGARAQDVLASRKTVAEGVTTARAVAGVAAANNIDMPITLAVDGIMSGALEVDAAIAGLLARSLRGEEE